MRFAGSTKPPAFRTGPGDMKIAPSRFDVIATLSGYDVIDYDGTPVAALSDYGLAEAERERLNDAAMGGGRSLAYALGGAQL